MSVDNKRERDILSNRGRDVNKQVDSLSLFLSLFLKTTTSETERHVKEVKDVGRENTSSSSSSFRVYILAFHLLLLSVV